MAFIDDDDKLRPARRVTNTERQAREHPEPILLDALGGKTADQIITGQEKRGQKELASGVQLPARINTYGDEMQKIGAEIKRLPHDDSWAKPLAESVYNLLGIEVLPRGTDDLFVDVRLPEGWSVKPTDHSMWSDLRDDRDRIRGTIFYKAAFYDREAFFGLSRRFRMDTYVPSDEHGNPVEYGKHSHFAAYVMDGGKHLQLFGVRDKESGMEASNKLGAACKIFLDEKYPDWENPLAYWDEPDAAAEEAKEVAANG